MTVVGSRFGSNNQYATGKGKGFTVTCNDCGNTLSNDDFYTEYCVICEDIPVFQCKNCRQEGHLHTSPHCTREINHVLDSEDSVGTLCNEVGGQ